MNKELRTYVTIDLDAIAANIGEVRKKIASDVKLMAVIKTDGYGHGAVEIGRYLEKDVDYYAVASVDEAVELRQAGLQLPILILGYTMHAQYPLLAEYDITQTIYSLEDAVLLSEAAMKAEKTVKVHIAVDTGMGRIGVMPDASGAAIVKGISELSGVEIEGMFTHFSTADETDKSYTRLQMQRYDSFVEQLEQEGIVIPLKHICNSAGIMEFDHHRYQMVRSGIITYGLYPSEEVVKENLELKPALEWKAHVVHVKKVAPGAGISYGKTFVTEKPETVIATVNVGYGDGYPRNLSNKGRVLIHGQSVPIVGRVCMDQFMVDVTDVENVQPEDVVTLIGFDGAEHISVEEAAGLAGTFNYEFVCGISKRVPRIFKGKKPVIFAVSGYKNSGKTTLTVKLVERLTEKGYRVATIKHDGHDFEPDVPGTDSYRHRKAGAYGCAVFSGHRWMVVKEQPTAETDRISERELIEMFPEADIILLEGFKNSGWPKYFCRYPESVPDEQEALKMIEGLMTASRQEL